MTPEEKRFAEINELWEEVQLAGLRLAKEVLLNEIASEPHGQIVKNPNRIATPAQVSLSVAVIRTFGPTPLGIDDFAALGAAAQAELDSADAVKSEPILGSN